MAKKEKKRQEQKTENAPCGTAQNLPPVHAASPEELPRHRQTPGDRAIDVLDNHTPDIDL